MYNTVHAVHGIVCMFLAMRSNLRYNLQSEPVRSETSVVDAVEEETWDISIAA